MSAHHARGPAPSLTVTTLTGAIVISGHGDHVTIETIGARVQRMTDAQAGEVLDAVIARRAKNRTNKEQRR